jgi:chloramphenicol-sensitive protein RarD
MGRGTETSGLLYGLAAYGLWGIVPLYFHALTDRDVSAEELLAQRIFWSTVLLSLVMCVIGGWRAVRRSLTNRGTCLTLIGTSILIGINWYLYIYAVSNKMLVEASLGYFIAPLVNTALGVVVLREKLRWTQVLAIFLAATGVLVMTVQQGHFPTLALGLAFSFSLYGLFRKTVASDALTGLMVESALLSIPSAAYLIRLEIVGLAIFGHRDRQTDLLLIAASVVTVVPLFCFANAAMRLRLTTIGFLQFLSPSVQFLLAILVLHEEFDVAKLRGFVPIWMALVVYTIDAVMRVRKMRAGQVLLTVAE